MKPDKEKLYIGFYKNTSPDYKKTVEAILSREYGKDYHIEWVDDQHFSLELKRPVYENDGITIAGYYMAHFPNCIMEFSEHGAQLIVCASDDKDSRLPKREAHSWERYKNHPYNKRKKR